MGSVSSLPVAALISVAFLSLVVALVLAAVETALSRSSRASVQDLVDDDRKGSDQFLRIVEVRDRSNLVLRGLRTFTQAVLAVALTLVLVATSLPWWATGLIALVVVSILQFVSVSLIASRWGGRNPEGVGLACAPWIWRMVQLSHVFDPMIHALRGWFPQPSRTEAEARAEMAEDLREMVDQVGETDILEEEDREMLRSVFELGHTLVREVMVPRTDMVTVGHDLPARKALGLFIRSGYSRIPVIGDDVDDVRGILYFKDVVQRMNDRGADIDLVAEQMMRPAEFTVEMKAADDLLRLMQADHFHMAMVVDEYGGISGLVTLEDLIEEVVGELTDEHDRRTVEPVEIELGVWKVPSRHSIWEVGELLGIEVEDDDVDSIGGLLAKAIGKVPLPGAEGSLSGIHMVAQEASGRRRQVGTIICSLADDEDEKNARGDDAAPMKGES